ncbi:Glutamate--tRNA ligase mitochondrial [Lithohypha guttulata]|uniref:Glutamate--tRNA ligase mitochondrial n=1 Tax=Lithohypha guttulata TaxID=1690604 RepID=UPI002DE1017A|nr:Glutamate--tRNA ligase mitochondrial [Lithohypha guttulata]
MQPSHQVGRRVQRWICASCRSRLGQSFEARKGFATSSRQNAKAKLPSTPVRTRFAPSPTGNLHLGSIRTALFNYLLARRTKGQFLLRIEDTDQKRTIPGAEQRLYQDLRWAGLQWDEGPEVGGSYGPYRQSERLPIYTSHVQTLLQNKSAYHCFCSSERIDQLNRLRHDRGLPLGYDRKCIDIPVEEAEDRASHGEGHVVRFRVPDQYPMYDDLVYGNSGHGTGRNLKKHLMDEPVFDDPVLIKSDAFPTYHFANVVDDKLMQITHVIRGTEWMSSTPLHVALYRAFQWTPPRYGHVPLLVDQNGHKLSKRNMDSDVASFREKGVFAEALTNFAALLGWSHQQKSDVMDLVQLEEIFSLKFTRGNTIVAFEKLHYLQEKHALARRRGLQGEEKQNQMIRDVSVELLNVHGAGSIMNFLGGRKLQDVVAVLLHVDSIPYRDASQFVSDLQLFFTDDSLRSRKPLQDVVPEVVLYPDLRVAVSTLFFIPEEYWNEAQISHHFKELAVNLGRGPEEAQHNTALLKQRLYQFLRWALLGGANGPHIPQAMAILGRKISETRIRDAIMATREIENESTSAKVDVATIPGKKQERGWQAHRLPSQAAAPS